MKLKQILLELLKGTREITLTGTISIYHFSKVENEKSTMIFDPIKAFKNQQHYSAKDYEHSNLPRVWFYTNLADAESSVKQMSTLYATKIKGSDIFDVNRALAAYSDDKEGLKKNSPLSYGISNAYMKVENLDKLLRNAKKAGFKGMYYDGWVPMLVYFYPIKATKVKTS